MVEDLRMQVPRLHGNHSRNTYCKGPFDYGGNVTRKVEIQNRHLFITDATPAARGGREHIRPEADRGWIGHDGLPVRVLLPASV